MRPSNIDNVDLAGFGAVLPTRANDDRHCPQPGEDARIEGWAIIMGKISYQDEEFDIEIATVHVYPEGDGFRHIDTIGIGEEMWYYSTCECGPEHEMTIHDDGNEALHVTHCDMS